MTAAASAARKAASPAPPTRSGPSTRKAAAAAPPDPLTAAATALATHDGSSARVAYIAPLRTVYACRGSGSLAGLTTDLETAAERSTQSALQVLSAVAPVVPADGDCTGLVASYGDAMLAGGTWPPRSPQPPTPSDPAPDAGSTTGTPAGAGSDTYTNVDGQQVQGPVAAPAAPTGATAHCVDGTWSFSQHRSGTCSHHGGVAAWL